MEELLNKLKKHTAVHTELVSVYIPSGFNIKQVLNQIISEKGTASNIKSNSTKKNVISALDSCINILKSYDCTPKNGLCVFCGESTDGFVSEVIIPTKKLNKRLYRCDKKFVLDPLLKMIGNNNYYLLVVIEYGDAILGLYNSGDIQIVDKIESIIPSENKAGGQSSQRFERIREDLRKKFLKKVSEFINTNFLFDKKLLGIIIGGTFVTVDDFSKCNYINKQLKDKIICTKSIDNDGEYGLRELANKSVEDIEKSEIIEKNNMVEDFFVKLSKSPEIVCYGESDVLNEINNNRVKSIITVDKKYKFEGIETIIIDEHIKRYNEIVGLGGVVAILYF